MLKAALDNTATIGVDAESVDLVGKGIEDEVNVLGLASLYRFLDDMVAVLVLDAANNIVFELTDQGSLLIVEDMIECL